MDLSLSFQSETMRKCLNDNWLFIYLNSPSPFLASLPCLLLTPPRIVFLSDVLFLLVVHFLWTSFVVVSLLFPLFLVSLSLSPLLCPPRIFLTLLCHFSYFFLSFLRLLLFLLLLLFVLSLPVVLHILVVVLLVVSYFVISFSGISFDLIIILSWQDKKPPTRTQMSAL